MDSKNQYRADFPIFNNESFAFLDTSASAQKPKVVIDEMNKIYCSSYANIHRGHYKLSEDITQLYENARKIVQKFINAKSDKEIIFTRNATEGINLVASTFGESNLKEGDEVLISEAEHHANIVAWQVLCERKKAKLKVFKIADDGNFVFENFEKALSFKTKIVAITAMSNVLGTIFPIKKICEKAKELGAITLVDACQFVPHYPIDVLDWDCDFLAFSGHKIYGPTGIGVLYGKLKILEEMPPYQFGGDMVERVSFKKTTFAKSPAKFEAGTPAIVEAIGLGVALEYILDIGFEKIMSEEKKLIQYALKKLSEIEGLVQVGTAKDKGGIFSFKMRDIHSEDVSFFLNKENVYVRAGHHCAEPLVNRMGYKALLRASIGIYSTKNDIDMLVWALEKAKTFFGKTA